VKEEYDAIDDDVEHQLPEHRESPPQHEVEDAEDAEEDHVDQEEREQKEKEELHSPATPPTQADETPNEHDLSPLWFSEPVCNAYSALSLGR